MANPESLQEQAERLVAEARGIQDLGRPGDSLEPFHRAVLLYAAADAAAKESDEPGPLKRPRAEACRLYADALMIKDQFAEAANIYQEATDLYGLLDDEESTRLARECARRLLTCVAELRGRPQDRLHLLIAHYERALQQLTLDPGTESKRAECCMHIARIYQRRDRHVDSVNRYRQALTLLRDCDSSTEIELDRAECHHRIATLLVQSLDKPLEAITHYREAIALYKSCEPFVYGFQQSLELCRAALARTEAALPRLDNGRNRQRSHE